MIYVTPDAAVVQDLRTTHVQHVKKITITLRTIWFQTQLLARIHALIIGSTLMPQHLNASHVMQTATLAQ